MTVMMLTKMMRQRQLYLIDLLKKYVEVQSSWQRRKERAEQLLAASDVNETKRNKLAQRAAQIAEQATDDEPAAEAVSAG